MNTVGAARMAFNGVWPTLLVHRRLRGFEQPNAGLVALILDMEAREVDFTARFHEQNFFGGRNPSVTWLKDQVDMTTSALLRHSGIGRSLSWKLFSWYNVNRRGDHHGPHTHPKSYLSGTYYARVPTVPAKLDDVHAHPGCISFYDPRTGANMITVGTEPDARPVHLVCPCDGTLLMWPSPLLHYVHPNLSSEPRISISFNVVMDGNTGKG